MSLLHPRILPATLRPKRGSQFARCVPWSSPSFRSVPFREIDTT